MFYGWLSKEVQFVQVPGAFSIRSVATFLVSFCYFIISLGYTICYRTLSIGGFEFGFGKEVDVVLTAPGT